MPSYPYFTKKIKTGGSVTIISPKFRGSISATVNCWRAVTFTTSVTWRTENGPHYTDQNRYFKPIATKFKIFFRAPPQNRVRNARKTASNRYLCRCHDPPGRPLRRLLNSTQLHRPHCRAQRLRRMAHCWRLKPAGAQFQLSLGRMRLEHRALRSASPISRRSNLARPPTLRAAATAYVCWHSISAGSRAHVVSAQGSTLCTTY